MQFLNAVTPNGTGVVIRTIVQGEEDLVLVTLDGDDTSETLLGTEFSERNAALSPDGAWMAFDSNASGNYEVYVRPFPDVEAGQWLVSTAGGRTPAWSPDGRALFYWQGNQFMATPVQTDAGFTNGMPQALFEGVYRQAQGRTYDVASDGRFLMVKPNGQADEDAPQAEITVVLNWFEELKARVPVP